MTEVERAALRAFLQRSEVRMSTLHRVATALLSGAGILVLLPTLSRDAFVNVLRALASTSMTAEEVLLLVAIAGVLVVVVTVIWSLLKEITQFYFHSNHIVRGDDSSFTPRFALASLRVPSDELDATGARELDQERGRDEIRAFLVPLNERSRRRIDRRIAAYTDSTGEHTDDVRTELLFDLVGATDRSLVAEVAKIEHVLARHTLRLQVVILRYVKALLVVLLTLFLVFGLTALTAGGDRLSRSAQQGVVIAVLLWAPAACLAASAPVRWLTTQLRHEGATATGVKYDPDLTYVERLVAVLTSLVVLAAVAAGVVSAARSTGVDPLVVAALAIGLPVHLAAVAVSRRPTR